MRGVRTAIEDARTPVLVSAVSVWEAAIKSALGKLRVPGELPERLDEFAFERLAVTDVHAWAVRALPHVIMSAGPPKSGSRAVARESPAGGDRRTLRVRFLNRSPMARLSFTTHVLRCVSDRLAGAGIVEQQLIVIEVDGGTCVRDAEIQESCQPDVVSVETPRQEICRRTAHPRSHPLEFGYRCRAFDGEVERREALGWIPATARAPRART